ncbi:MAG: hypothetical protein CR985_02795 [Flavobacteriales bacterium]|nr:MAG: hypothetical protein CR985_02795 [Flavobacteriales bacterium]
MKKMIMKYPTIIFLAVIFVLAACEKDIQTRKTTCTQQGDYDYLDNYNVGVMCSSNLCNVYYEIWKELIKEKNNLSQDFIDSHIILCHSEIDSWANGISFRICYKIKLDWAIAYNCDQFIIKINKENTLYPSLDLPRDTYLTKDKIKIAVDNRAFSSDISKITNKSDLEYIDMESALNELIDFSGVNILCMNRVALDDDTGNLVLEASAQYENEENSCIQGTIDLISGDKNVNNIPCWID